MKIPKTIKIKKCRLCKNTKLKQIYNFGNHYVSNFVSKASIYKGEILSPKIFAKKLLFSNLKSTHSQLSLEKKLMS